MTTCAICGETSARKISSVSMLRLLGHDESFKRSEFKCKSCGEAYTTDEQASDNDREERSATVRALAVIGAAELRALRELTRVTQAELENALGLGKSTVARWETGGRVLPAYIKNMVRLLAVNPAALHLLREQELPESERVESLSGKFDIANDAVYHALEAHAEASDPNDARALCDILLFPYDAIASGQVKLKQVA